MFEDSYLDTFMEDRMSGGGYWDHDETAGCDPYDDVNFGRYDDEDDDEGEEYDPEPREDFGWFGDEALCGE